MKVLDCVFGLKYQSDVRMDVVVVNATLLVASLLSV
jgi:hypothetical protein